MKNTLSYLILIFSLLLINPSCRKPESDLNAKIEGDWYIVIGRSKGLRYIRYEISKSRNTKGHISITSYERFGTEGMNTFVYDYKIRNNDMFQHKYYEDESPFGKRNPWILFGTIISVSDTAMDMICGDQKKHFVAKLPK